MQMFIIFLSAKMKMEINGKSLHIEVIYVLVKADLFSLKNNFSSHKIQQHSKKLGHYMYMKK